MLSKRLASATLNIQAGKQDPLVRGQRRYETLGDQI
jgi:hypothetical protein